MRGRQTAESYALLLGVAQCFSGTWVAGKVAVTLMPPFELSAIRFAMAGVLLLGAAFLRRADLGLARWRPVLFGSFCGIFAYNALVFSGLRLAPASDAALIVPTLNPVIAVALATFVGERVSRTRLLGFVLAALGTTLTVASGQLAGEISAQRLAGDILIVLGAVGWSAYAVIGTVTMKIGSPLGVTALSCLFGSLLFAPLGFLEDGYRDITRWPADGWFALLYLAVVVTTLGFALFYAAVRRVGAGRAVLVSYLVPLLALIQAHVLLGDEVTAPQVASTLVILVGLWFATRPGELSGVSLRHH